MKSAVKPPGTPLQITLTASCEVQRFQVRTGHPEILDALVAGELRVNEPRRILHELDVGAVQLGESLLVLAPDHDLCLGLQRRQAMRLQILDREPCSVGHLHPHAGL